MFIIMIDLMFVGIYPHSPHTTATKNNNKPEPEPEPYGGRPVDAADT